MRISCKKSQKKASNTLPHRWPPRPQKGLEAQQCWAALLLCHPGFQLGPRSRLPRPYILVSKIWDAEKSEKVGENNQRRNIVPFTFSVKTPRRSTTRRPERKRKSSPEPIQNGFFASFKRCIVFNRKRSHETAHSPFLILASRSFFMRIKGAA